MCKKIFIILHSNIFFVQIYVYMLSDNAVGIEEIYLEGKRETMGGRRKQ